MTGMFIWMDAVLENMKQARILYRTYCELNSLTDRELEDLGLSRTDIPRIVFEVNQ